MLGGGPAHLPLGQKLMGRLSGQTVDSALWPGDWPPWRPAEPCVSPCAALTPSPSPTETSGPQWHLGLKPKTTPTWCRLHPCRSWLLVTWPQTPSHLGSRLLLAEPPRWHRQWDAFLQS